MNVKELREKLAGYHDEVVVAVTCEHGSDASHDIVSTLGVRRTRAEDEKGQGRRTLVLYQSGAYRSANR